MLLAIPKYVEKISTKSVKFNWLLGLAIFLLFIDIFSRIVDGDIIISDKNIILAFVGILATFVVVSNYIQVKYIENKLAEYKNIIDDKMKAADEKISKKADAYLYAEITGNKIPCTGDKGQISVASNTYWELEVIEG